MEKLNSAVAKVPEITLVFWIIKIAATTLGETGGDAASMSLNLGYLVSTIIFAVVFLIAVVAQVKADRFNPVLYWVTIIATTTVGTTLADFADRSLGIGYAGGSLLLIFLLLASLLVWYRTMGSVAVTTVSSAKAEMFYWVTIMFSQTLGTALGDWTADTAGLGYSGAALVFGGLLLALVIAYYATTIRRIAALLGGVHPDPAAGRSGRRLPRQTHRKRRSCNEPIWCLNRARAVHSGLRVHISAAACRSSPLAASNSRAGRGRRRAPPRRRENQGSHTWLS
jgi:uncharacterized membrane-anchored protein